MLKMWVQCLEEIKNTSSSNLKKEIFFNYLNNSSIDHKVFIQSLFDLLLNYKVNSYLSDIDKLQKNLLTDLHLLIDINSNESSEDYFFNVIYKIIKNNDRFKKLEWIDILKNLASKCKSIHELNYYIQFIEGSLTIGLANKNFNEVVKNIDGMEILEEFQCMRCSSIADSTIDFSNSYCSIKKDGVNCTVLDNKFYTRNGNDLILPHISDELFPIFKDYVVFGELVSTNRSSSIGLVTSVIKLGVCSKLDVSVLKLHIFDIIPKKDFETKNFKDYPFYKRLEILKQFSNGKNYEIIEHHKTTSLDEVYAWNDYYYNLGEEGIVCNDSNGIIELKRSKFRAKVKAEIDNEFKITGYTVHSKKENWLGSFTIESYDGLIKSSVGSGFTEQERIEYWEDRDKLINKICTVRYNSIDKKHYSLFLPVWKCLRVDKNEADLITISDK